MVRALETLTGVMLVEWLGKSEFKRKSEEKRGKKVKTACIDNF